MNYQSETHIESLLNQMQLAKPSRQLDDSIAGLAGHTAVTTRRPARQFSWKALAVTALAASVLGLLAGITTSGERRDEMSVASNSLRNVSTTRVFQTMHGHSGNAQFHDCSACHAFKSKHEQTVRKWLVDDRESAGALGLPKCSMCHLQNDQLIATGVGPKS